MACYDPIFIVDQPELLNKTGIWLGASSQLKINQGEGWKPNLFCHKDKPETKNVNMQVKMSTNEKKISRGVPTPQQCEILVNVKQTKND